MGQMKRDMQFDSSLDDFRFRQHQQGGFNMEWVSFHTGFRAFFHRRFIPETYGGAELKREGQTFDSGPYK